jgi:hypothetical protein
MAKRKIEMTQTKHVTQPDTSAPTQTLSLRDFRSWLSGVEEMQDDGWSPSAEQWRRIRVKIDMIKDEPSVGVTNTSPAAKVPVYPTSTTPVAAPPSTFERVPVPAAPPQIPSNVPMASVDGQIIKTPSSDTVGYKTSFA